MATGGEENEPGLHYILKFCWKGKFDEEHDKNDRGSDQVKMCFVFCGASYCSTGNSGYLKFFWQTWGLENLREIRIEHKGALIF